MGEILGEGEFGLVQKAMWRNEENNRVISVAVKTVKGKGLNIGNRFYGIFFIQSKWFEPRSYQLIFVKVDRPGQ